MARHFDEMSRRKALDARDEAIVDTERKHHAARQSVFVDFLWHDGAAKQGLWKGRECKEPARLVNIGKWADAKCVPGADKALGRFVPTCQGKIAEHLVQTGRPKPFQRGQEQRIFRNRRIAAQSPSKLDRFIEPHIRSDCRCAEFRQCRGLRTARRKIEDGEAGRSVPPQAQ
ncbi:MAG: hypothetical protein WBE80_15255 [Methylocella sp.]